MSNPWFKSNPFLSMWLSGVNQMMNTMRAQASSLAKRQITSGMDTVTKENPNPMAGVRKPALGKPKSKPKTKSTDQNAKGK